MKKYILFVILVIVVIISTSCTEKSLNSVIKEHQPYITKGADDNIFVGDISDLSFVGDENTLPPTVPVYQNKYPIGEVGPLFEFDQTTNDLFSENLKGFLRILYNTEDVSSYYIEVDSVVGYIVFFDTGTFRINSGPFGISMFTAEYDLMADTQNGNLLDNRLVQSAIEYLKIMDPKIILTTDYSSDGEIYKHNYRITEATNDFFQDVLNNSFSFIEIIDWIDLDGISLIITNVDITELSSEATVSYEDVTEYVISNYNAEESDINAEVYYSELVDQGYFIPCYKIYIEGDQVGSPVNGIEYEVIHIPMVQGR